MIMRTKPCWTMSTPSAAAWGSLMVSIGACLTLPAFGQKLFFENFDAVPLGPNVEEASVGAKVWTRTPPTGWVIDDTGMPGYGQPDYADRDGRTEWAGWSFADVKWWPTVDNQRRSEFTLASGAAAIADNDEWDDAGHYPGLFNSFLSTPEIAVTGKAANSLVLAFDSSWRPEARDDGAPNFPVDENGSPTNNQTAVITAQWDGGAPVEVIRWESVSDSPFFKADGEFINEAALAALNNPAGAQKLKLKFGLINAANDWWWAFDNLAVGEPPLLTGLTGTGIGFTARISEALGKTVNDAVAITGKLDGQSVTATATRDGERVLVTHDQSPKIFAPLSTHTVEVSFTTGEGKQVTDTAEFTAPGYTTASATPTSLTATISETSYLTVDESKGVQLELDGAAVTATSVKREDLAAADGTDLPDRILVTYSTGSSVFASGSTHGLKVSFTTTTAQVVAQTFEFKAPDYVTLAAGLGTAVGTGADEGMRWRTHQLAARATSNIATVESQLRGELGPSIHDPSSQNSAGYFEMPYINFEQVGADAGNFKLSSSIGDQQVTDDMIPGIPGLEGGNDNIAGEGLAFVEIPAAGVYTMVVNSDDGFQVSVGNATNTTYQVLGKVDSTRGAADTAFYFRVEQPGVYLFRLLWFEGGGGASVEWFTVKANGERALVNGLQTGALKAYQRRTVAEPAIPSAAGGVAKIGLQAGKVVIEYTGTLKSAGTVNGTYAPVSGAVSPYSVTPTEATRFFLAN